MLSFTLKMLLPLLLLCASHQIDALQIGHFLSSSKDIVTGVAKDTTKLLPTPEGLFDASKQLIAGYPFEFASTAINKICSSALSSQSIRPKITPNIAKLQFQFKKNCENFSYPLLQANELWSNPKFNAAQKVVILATGWTTNVNDSSGIELFSRAFNCRGDVNFVALDAARFIDTLYTWSAFNTEEIGMHIAKGLVQLSKIVPVANIHLIGHSLGAHIVGAAGRHFNYMTGQLIPRITGLDPAKPCFNEGQNLSGLLRGDAAFIDVIHSNPGVLGKRDTMGDVDFYPNGLDPLMPGCLTIVCAHERAWQYFGETIFPGNEMNFMAQRCTSLTNLREDKCPGPLFPMGYATPMNLKGNYFLEINGEQPFGMNSKAYSWADCGACPAK